MDRRRVTIWLLTAFSFRLGLWERAQRDSRGRCASSPYARVPETLRERYSNPRHGAREADKVGMVFVFAMELELNELSCRVLQPLIPKKLSRSYRLQVRSSPAGVVHIIDALYHAGAQREGEAVAVCAGSCSSLCFVVGPVSRPSAVCPRTPNVFYQV